MQTILLVCFSKTAKAGIKLHEYFWEVQ